MPSRDPADRNPQPPASRLLTVDSRRTAEGPLLVPSGELDIDSAPVLDEALRRAADAETPVTVDLRELTFMDSTGLHLLVDAATRLERSGGSLTLVRGRPEVQRVFEITGLDARLAFVDEPPA